VNTKDKFAIEENCEGCTNLVCNRNMSQELQYLRDEMNQKLKFLDEHPQKVINMILIIWGATSFFLGTDRTIFDDNVRYVFIVTIFFISNLILYFSVQNANDNIDGITKIAAYIIVFYEKRPSETIKVGVDNNISWEIASIEFESHEKHKSWFKRNREYMALMILSILGILVFTVMFVLTDNLEEKYKILGVSISNFYVSFSLFLLYKIYKFFKSFSKAKEMYLKSFFQYSLKTKHYTEEEIEERFGDFWRKLTQK